MKVMFKKQEFQKSLQDLLDGQVVDKGVEVSQQLRAIATLSDVRDNLVKPTKKGGPSRSCKTTIVLGGKKFVFMCDTNKIALIAISEESTPQTVSTEVEEVEENDN